MKDNSQSFFYVNGTSGNVGVGTTLPASKFEVLGGMQISGLSTLIGGAVISDDVTIGTSPAAAYPSSNADVFVQGNVESDGTLYGYGMMLSSGNTVNAIVTTISSPTNLQIPTAAAVSTYVASQVTTPAMITQGDTTVAVIDSGANGQILFDINGSTSMIMDQYGNIGIGTIAPQYPFHIKSQADLGATLNSGGIGLRPVISGSGGGIAGLRIIPSISPLASIGTVYGTINLANLDNGSGYTVTHFMSNFYRYDTQVTFTGAITNAYSLYLSAPTLLGSKPTNGYGIRVQNQGQSGITNSYGLYLDSQSGSSTLNYSIYSAGGNSYFAENIGVGTAVPFSKLEVDGTIYIKSGTGNIGIGSVTPRGSIDVDGAMYGYSMMLSSGNTVNSIVTTISSPTNLQIPTAAAVSSYVSANPGIPASITSGDTTVIITDGGATGQVEFKINGSTSLIVDQNGNFGIGTSVPASRFALMGAGTSTNKMIEFYDSGKTSRFVVLDNGNVGIGSSVPAAALDVNGTLSVSLAGSGYTTGAFGIGSSTAIGAGNILGVQGGMTVGSAAYFTTTAPANGLLVSGNVGIGSTVPRGRLDVDTTLYVGTGLAGDKLVINNNLLFASEYNAGTCSGGTTTINWQLGNKQRVTLGAGCVIAFTSPGTGVTNLQLKVLQDGTGGRTISWPAAAILKWPAATAPTLTTTATTGLDIITFYYDSSVYYGLGSLDFR